MIASMLDEQTGCMTQTEQQYLSQVSKHTDTEKQTDSKEHRTTQNISVPNCFEAFYSNRQSLERSGGRKFHQLDSSITKQVVTHQTLHDLQ